MEYLEHGTLPDNEVERRQIVRRAKGCTIINGQLYKISTTGVYLKCVSQQQGIDILREIHLGDCGHHTAPRYLVSKAFHQGFYWLTAKADADKLVETCVGCRYYARQPHVPGQELRSILVTWLFAVWVLDMVGPLQTTPCGFTHLLVVVDKFKK